MGAPRQLVPATPATPSSPDNYRNAPGYYLRIHSSMRVHAQTHAHNAHTMHKHTHTSRSCACKPAVGRQASCGPASRPWAGKPVKRQNAGRGPASQSCASQPAVGRQAGCGPSRQLWTRPRPPPPRSHWETRRPCGIIARTATDGLPGTDEEAELRIDTECFK